MFLLALVMLSLGHLGHKKCFYLKSLIFFSVTKQTIIHLHEQKTRAFVLALLDTSTLSGLAARGRPTLTSEALNFLIYQ